MVKDQISIAEQYQRSRKEESLFFRFPELAKEWHPTKNGMLKPENVPPAYTKKVWWKCLKCGYEWNVTPNSRISIKDCTVHMCPKCSAKIVNQKNCIKVRNITTSKVYSSMSEASKETGVSISKIAACCKGQRKTSGGFRWEYVDRPRRGDKDRHKSRNIDTGIVYENSKLAAESCGYERGTNILLCCKGKTKTAYGYRWEYAGTRVVMNVDTGSQYKTFHEAAIAVGGDYRYIKKCCEGEIEVAYGYKWIMIDVK